MGLKTIVYCQCFRALSQSLARRSTIPQAQNAGTDRRRRAQNAGFYRASAHAGMPNGRMRKKQKMIRFSLIWYNIEIRSINSISRAVSQHLSERRDIPRAKAEGRHRRRRAQNAGFYRASALVGMSNGQLRINKQNEMICAIFELY